MRDYRLKSTILFDAYDSSYSNMSLIADSFSEFVAKCHEYIDED